MSDNNVVKQRHGFTTFWLVLLVIGIVFGLFGAIGLASAGVSYAFLNIAGIAFQIFAVVNLFAWKKIGFTQYMTSNLFKMWFLIFNSLANPFAIFLLILDAAILWGVLQIKAENGKTCWEQLETSVVPKKD